MKHTLLAIGLCAGLSLPGRCLAGMPVQETSDSGYRILSCRSELLTVPVRFVHRIPSKDAPPGSKPEVYVRSDGINGGRWQRPSPLYGNIRFDRQIGSWDIRAEDGSEAHAGVLYDAVDPNGAKKIMKIEAKQFRGFPDWVFYRYSGCVPNSMSFATIALRSQPKTNARYLRSVWIAWDGGCAECGDTEKVPWFRRNHKMIDAYAVYSLGGETEPRECEMAVWLPEQYSSIHPQRFHRNDDRFVFYFVNAKGCAGEYTFALGARRTDSGEKVNAPAFLKEERHAVAKKLRSIDWTLKADIPAIERKYEEVRKMLESGKASGKLPELPAEEPDGIPDEELPGLPVEIKSDDPAKELPGLLEEIKSGDAVRALKAERRLDEMKETLSSAKLEELFD